MIKTAKQLKDLIRNLSKKKSADAQILMRNYMLERFLERISLSAVSYTHLDVYKRQVFILPLYGGFVNGEWGERSRGVVARDSRGRGGQREGPGK